jgi:hypothetical protein
MSKAPQPRWWTVRRAQNRKPATYRCPLCGRLLPALSEHMLIAPEGDTSRRRHAHTACVLSARKAGRLPSRDEWAKTQPAPPRRPGPLTRARTTLSRAVRAARAGRTARPPGDR